MWELALPLVYINLFGAAIYVLLCGQQDCHRGTFIERWNAFLLGGCFESLAYAPFILFLKLKFILN
jgi:hypothetical protein